MINAIETESLATICLLPRLLLLPVTTYTEAGVLGGEKECCRRGFSPYVNGVKQSIYVFATAAAATTGAAKVKGKWFLLLLLLQLLLPCGYG